MLFQPVHSFRKSFYSFLCLILVSSTGLAGGDTPVSNGLKYITNALLGTTGITIATISLIAVGIMCKIGIWEWKRFIQVIVGMGIVFGAPAIVNGVVSLIHA